MNTNTLKTVGLYVGGTLVGAAVGAVVGSLIVDQILANENGDMQRLEEGADGEESEESDEPVKLKKPRSGKMTKLDYTKFALRDDGKSDPLNTLAEKYEHHDEDSWRKEIDMSQPYVISADDYSEGGQNNAKLTLTYYDEDDVLTDQEDTVIVDPSYLVGDDSLVKFGMNSNDEDIVYVRNTKLSTDYEIVRVHKSYSETVLGIVDKKVIRKVKKDAEA